MLDFPRFEVVLAALILGSPSNVAAIDELPEALAAAYRDNAEIRAARAELRALDDEIASALALGRPSLLVSSEARLQGRYDRNGFAEDFVDEHRLTLSQSLYEGGGVEAAVEGARERVEAGRARLAATVQEVFEQVVEAYSALVRDGEVLALADRNVSRLKRRLEAAEIRFRAGENTRTDVAQARSRLAGAEAEFERAAGSVDRSAAVLEALLGEAPAFELAPPEPIVDLPDSLAEALRRAREHPATLERERETAAAEAAVDRALAALEPSVTLDAQLGFAGAPADGVADERAVASVGASVQWPLYQGGGAQARVRRNRQLLAQARERSTQAEREAARRVQEAWRALETARAAMASVIARRSAAQEALDGVREERAVGLRTTLDVLDAEQELFAADVALADVEREQVVSSYALKAAIGELDDRVLTADVERYRVDAYHRRWSDAWYGVGDRESGRGSPGRSSSP